MKSAANYKVDPDVTVNGVSASAFLIVNAEGEPIVAIDQHGNIGTQGSIRAKSVTTG